MWYCGGRTDNVPKLKGLERYPVYVNKLTKDIIGACIQVSNYLGHGFPETIYSNALIIELQKRGLRAQQQVPLDVRYDGILVGRYFADVIVEEKVILELKAVECLLTDHQTQLINYLTATGFEIGLLVNFGKPKVEFKRCHPRTKETPSSELREAASED